MPISNSPIPTVERPKDEVEMEVLGEIFVELNSIESDCNNLTPGQIKARVTEVRQRIGTYIIAREQTE